MGLALVLSGTSFTDISGAEPADSISDRLLEEVTVEAARQRNTPTSTVYIPAERERRAAQNAIDLLKLMNITQISVDAVNKTVSDNFGEGVTIFINYLESRQEDIEGMRTSDVRKARKSTASGMMTYILTPISMPVMPPPVSTL